ncbi:TolC family protein [Candidatus Neomarinimicrobiota bacterium]
MKHTRLIFLMLTTLYSTIPGLNAQTITLDEFMNQLRLAHPVFEKEELTVQIDKEIQMGYLGAKDWLISSGPYYSRLNPLPPGSFTPDRIDQLNFGAVAQRAFWKTGGRLSFSWSSDRTDQIGLQNIVLPLGDLTGNPAIPDMVFETGPSKYYQNALAVTYTHPLLKNRGGFLDRLQYDLKQYDIDFSEVHVIENQEGFLAEVAAKFLDWVLLTEQKQIMQDRLKLNESELARTKEKKEANLIDEVDVLRAEDALRIAKQNQILLESRWSALQSELAVLSMNSDIFEMSPEFDINSFEDIMTFEEASTYLNGNSRPIRSLQVRLDQLKYAQKGYEEISKPDLSFIAQLNSKNLAEDFGESMKLKERDAYLGFQFSFPLGNRTAKSQMTQSELQTQRLEKELLDLSLTLTSTLINIYVQIEQMEEVLRLNEEQIESAKKRTEEELKLYNQGRGEMTFVIQSQDSEENSKLTYAINAVTYHKLIIVYKSLMDQLL